MKYLGIEIDLERDKLASPSSWALLKNFYLGNDENTLQYLYARAATAFCFGDFALAQRMYDYISLDYCCPASPILSNAPEITWPDPNWSTKNKKELKSFEAFANWLARTDIKLKGLPISCYLNKVGDTIKDITNKTTETRYMTIKGGGVGTDFSSVRSYFAGKESEKKTPGIMPFIKTVDSDMLAFHQGSTRRGSCAIYLDVSHPEIFEFLDMRVPQGDMNRKCLNLHNAVNLDDTFWYAVERGTKIDLIDPHTGSKHGETDARELFERIVQTRFRTGEPYIHNIDISNSALNPYLKTKGLRINGSNLCNEIFLPTAPDYSAVCCLSSLNLEKYDEWKDTNIVKDMIRFLDNVMEFFIIKAPEELADAVRSAKNERSLGLGVFGFHSYLQKCNVAWESALAISYNKRIFNDIKQKALQSSKDLAIERGVPDGLKGGAFRNAHLMAIAPTSNIALIKNSSSGIEPIASNYYLHQTRAGNFPMRNKYLEVKIEQYRDTAGLDQSWVDSVWEDILASDGSVQQFDWMSEYDKEVFKTAFEIDQRWIIDLAADRQRFICQGQSLNLFFDNDADINYVMHCHYRAWKKGCKGLYYLRTKAPSKRENVGSKVNRVALKDGDSSDECLGCNG